MFDRVVFSSSLSSGVRRQSCRSDYAAEADVLPAQKDSVEQISHEEAACDANAKYRGHFRFHPFLNVAFRFLLPLG